MNISIIGCGNMGQAILNGICGRHRVSVCEQDVKRAAFIRRHFKVNVKDLSAIVAGADVFILAVKPQDMDPVLAQLRQGVNKKHLVISIAAGITTSFLQKRLGKGVRVIRTMPNMPAQIGEGITAIAQGKSATQADIRMTERIFQSVGKTVVVKESLMDAVTAVSGSGPAYVFLFAECLWRAACELGLDKDLACQLVPATIKGSVHQMLQSKVDPAGLRAKVTSKGGTTQAAMDVFMRHRLKDIFIEALLAAKRRAGELSK
jgi:pyrroline-5-carboxylate reductase